MKNKTCAHCQYFRAPDVMPAFDETWCSNSKSKSSLAHVTKSDTCDQFSKRGKKAPWWMRIAKKVLK